MKEEMNTILRNLKTTGIILILLLVFLIFIILKNETTVSYSKTTQTEKSVQELKGVGRIPKTAFWIEKEGKGNWFNVDWIHNHKNNAVISIYDKYGELIFKGGFFKICPMDDLKYIEDLKKEIDFYDGENIQLKDKCYLLKKR